MVIQYLCDTPNVAIAALNATRRACLLNSAPGMGLLRQAAAVYQSFEQTEDPEETDDGITATFQVRTAPLLFAAGADPQLS